jgi:hypothetical protein
MTSKAMRSVVCLVLLLGILSMTGFAANKGRVGTAGAQELLIPVGARGVALGYSSEVFLKGVDALYWNPAGLSRMDGSVEAMFSQMSYIADISVSYGAIGVRAGDFGDLGFTLKSLSFGNIPVTTVDYPDGTGELYSPSYLTFGVTYSRLLTDRISVGVTANLVSEKILSMSASGIAFNVGIQYQNLGIQGLMLSVTAKNIGGNMRFDGANAYLNATPEQGNRGTTPYKVDMASFEMPTCMEIGLGYFPKLDEKSSIAIGGAFRNNNYLDDEVNFGAEYSYLNTVFIRGGYTFAPQASKDITGDKSYIFDWTLGAGIQYDVGGVRLGFDYAYRNVKYFSGSNVLTIMVAF